MSYWSIDIEKDLNWREAELASLKLEVVRSTKNTTKYQALLRAAWALLYAHYEGFCKFSWSLYLDEVKKAGNQRKDVRDDLVIFSLTPYFSKLKHEADLEKTWDFIRNIYPRLMSESIDFPSKFETSNLWPSELKEYCKQICFPYNTVDEHETLLKALVSRRNDIAHGQKMNISFLDYETCERATLIVMHEQAIAVVDCLENRLYLK